MINKLVKHEHVLLALSEIDKTKVPSRRQSTKYDLHHDGKIYPPKYVLSIATKFASGKELEASEFGGGDETNNFLISLGFEIREGYKIIKKNNSEIQSTNRKINICTAIIQIPGDNWADISNSKKHKMLSELLENMYKYTDILILPAGFLNSKAKEPKTIYKKTEKIFSNLIKEHNDKLTICFGIDGRNGSKGDQMGLAINKSGIIAVARKFHHTNDEVNLADSPFSEEDGMRRDFIIKGKRPFIAVCYDVYGIRKKNLENTDNYDFVIGLIHEFEKNRGGDSDFARKGLAGASKQWNVNTYASSVFSGNRNPSNWPSGVEWNHGEASVKDFYYDDIRLENKSKELETDIAKIYLRYFQE